MRRAGQDLSVVFAGHLLLQKARRLFDECLRPSAGLRPFILPIILNAEFSRTRY